MLAQIKDWNIECGRASVFFSENGKQILIRDDRGDVALVKENPENFTIHPDNNVFIAISDTEKKIIIARK